MRISASHVEFAVMALSVGLLGFGTVGQSVARLIVERNDGLLALSHIFNRDIARKRVDWVPSSVVWTERVEDVLDAGVDVVVEVVGGLRSGAHAGMRPRSTPAGRSSPPTSS